MQESVRPSTLGELKASGYTRRSVREEMRRNLLAHARRAASRCCRASSATTRRSSPRSRTRSSPGITWCSSASAGRGRAASSARLRRFSIPPIPVVAGCADQRRPVRADLRRLPPRGARPRATRWRSRGSVPTQRYGEKLATPDVSMADLIGEIDPVKVAEGRYLADEETIHYGLIPRTQPRHLRHQRAARPHREGAGRTLQPDGGARRPDQGLQASACRSTW